MFSVILIEGYLTIDFYIDTSSDLLDLHILCLTVSKPFVGCTSDEGKVIMHMNW